MSHSLCDKHSDNYHSYLALHETETLKAAEEGERHCLPLSQIDISASDFVEIVDQIYRDTPIDLISLPWPPSPERKNISLVADAFDKYIENLNGDAATQDSVNEINERIKEILGARTPEQQRLSGLVVGRVQSGKTRNYVGLMLKAASCGWNVIFVLTSCSTALGIQTFRRIEKDFRKSNVKTGFTLNNVDEEKQTLKVCKTAQTAANISNNNFFWGVALKQKDHLDNIIKWFEDNKEYAREMRVMIIDDEADNASPEANAHAQIWDEDTVDEKIEDIREQNSDIATWFDSLFDVELTDGQVDVISGLLANGSNKQRMEKLFDNAQANELLMLDGGIKSTLKKQFNKGGKAENINSVGCFVKLLQSILALVAGRSIINSKIRTIIDRGEKGEDYTFSFASCAYIGYTATPYACFFNRPPAETPLYPDFVYSLQKSDKYFGLEEIFGFDKESPKPRLDIITCLGEESKIGEQITGVILHKEEIPEEDSVPYCYINPQTLEYELRISQRGKAEEESLLPPVRGTWQTLKDAVAWAFCTAAARRYYHLENKPDDGSRGLAWTTMMINLSPNQGAHERLQKLLTIYLKTCCDEANREKFIAECKEVWDKQTAQFTNQKFYDALKRECDPYENWEHVKEDIVHFMQPGYHRVIQINSTPAGKAGQKDYEDGGDTENKKAVRKDTLWFICGGNAISRGLTLEGLTVSYFDRIGSSTAVDTFTQMGRWFGYRPHYELLPRLLMKADTIKQYKNAAFTEKNMHDQLRDSFEKKIPPSEGENFLTLYYWGRRLSGRAFEMKVLTAKIETAFSLNDISLVPENIAYIRECISDFLKDRSRYNNAEAFYPHCPVWSGISSQEILEFLKKLMPYSPESSIRTINALCYELEKIENNMPQWDIVIGSEFDNKKTVATPHKLWQDFYVSAGSPKPYINGEIAKYTSARSIVAYYAMIKREYINKLDAKLLDENAKAIIANIEEQQNKLGQLPSSIDRALPPGEDLEERFYSYVKKHQETGEDLAPAIHYLLRGNSSLEGYRNRSSRDYRLRAYHEANKNNPVLQIYPVSYGDNLLFAISFFWPNHVPDEFMSVALGDEPVKASESQIKTAIEEILQDYDFYMPRGLLANELQRKFGDKLSDQIFSAALNSNKAWNKRSGQYIYYAHTWAADENIAEEKFTALIRKLAFDILLDTKENLSRKNLIMRITVMEPKLRDLLDYAKPKDQQFFSNTIMTAEFREKMNIVLTKPNHEISYQWKPEMEA